MEQTKALSSRRWQKTSFSGSSQRTDWVHEACDSIARTRDILVVLIQGTQKSHQRRDRLAVQRDSPQFRVGVSDRARARLGRNSLIECNHIRQSVDSAGVQVRLGTGEITKIGCLEKSEGARQSLSRGWRRD